MVTRRSFTLAAAAAALSAAAPKIAGAFANTTPESEMSNPITIIVPFAKNGTTDQIARLIAGPLSKALSVEVKVDNITGDWGVTGAVVAANSRANGQTLIMGQIATHVFSSRKGMSTRYDAVRDFTPIGLVGTSPITFVARKDLWVSDIRDLNVYAISHGLTMTIAHGGYGTPSHIGAMKLKAAIGAKSAPEKVYASTSAALQDVAAGAADIMSTSLSQALPYIKAGQVKALGLAASSRNAALPEAYTGTQQGYEDLRLSHWNGLFAPKGLHPEIQKRLAAGLSAALNEPGLARKMRELGIHVPFAEQQGPEALALLQAREIAELMPSIA